MERGARQLVKILAWALLVGVGVLVLRPEYRKALAAIWHGDPEASPVWTSNAGYYPGIRWEAAPRDAD